MFKFAQLVKHEFAIWLWKAKATYLKLGSSSLRNVISRSHWDKQNANVFRPQECEKRMYIKKALKWEAHDAVIVLSLSHIELFCDPLNCSPPGSSVRGIFQARTLEWVAKPPPGDLPGPGIEPKSTALAAGSLPLGHPGRPTAGASILQSL